MKDFYLRHAYVYIYYMCSYALEFDMIINLWNYLINTLFIVMLPNFCVVVCKKLLKNVL